MQSEHPVTGRIVLAEDTFGCTATAAPADGKPFVLLALRGGCNFSIKAEAAVASRASAVRPCRRAHLSDDGLFVMLDA